MSKSAIRFLTLVVCATALVVAAADTPASARTSGKASSHQHVKKHHKVYRSSGFGYRRPADQGWSTPQPSYPSGSVCPGIGRSFECKIWPPPMDEDPDRKMSGSDGM
jgi:hypothetical protein